MIKCLSVDAFFLFRSLSPHCSVFFLKAAGWGGVAEWLVLKRHPAATV